MKRLGDHPMTSSERQRRYLARLAGSRPAPVEPPAPVADPVARAQERLVEQIRRYPAWTVPWLCAKLGRRATAMLVDETNRWLAAAPPDGSD